MMVELLRLYLRYIAISIRSQLQYRASMLMWASGHFAITATEFFALWAMFDRFGQLRGWALPEVALLYGMAGTAFAIAEASGRGFDIFDEMVKSGDFDRLLLRPRGTAFQVGARHFQLIRIGRFTQALAVMIYALVALDVAWTVPKATLLVASVAGGACTFVGIFVLQATLAFWTTEGLEVGATVTYGGVETTRYPLSIYTDNFRRFFTYVIPLAFLNYIPGLALLDRAERFGPDWLAWVSPVVGVVFLLAALRVWRFGERRYRSTGS